MQKIKISVEKSPLSNTYKNLNDLLNFVELGAEKLKTISDVSRGIQKELDDLIATELTESQVKSIYELIFNSQSISVSASKGIEDYLRSIVIDTIRDADSGTLGQPPLPPSHPNGDALESAMAFSTRVAYLMTAFRVVFEDKKTTKTTPLITLDHFSVGSKIKCYAPETEGRVIKIPSINEGDELQDISRSNLIIKEGLSKLNPMITKELSDDFIKEALVVRAKIKDLYENTFLKDSDIEDDVKKTSFDYAIPELVGHIQDSLSEDMRSLTQRINLALQDPDEDQDTFIEKFKRMMTHVIDNVELTRKFALAISTRILEDIKAVKAVQDYKVRTFETGASLAILNCVDPLYTYNLDGTLGVTKEIDFGLVRKAVRDSEVSQDTRKEFGNGMHCVAHLNEKVMSKLSTMILVALDLQLRTVNRSVTEEGLASVDYSAKGITGLFGNKVARFTKFVEDFKFNGTALEMIKDLQLLFRFYQSLGNTRNTGLISAMGRLEIELIRKVINSTPLQLDLPEGFNLVKSEFDFSEGFHKNFGMLLSYMFLNTNHEENTYLFHFHYLDKGNTQLYHSDETLGWDPESFRLKTKTLALEDTQKFKRHVKVKKRTKS